MEKPSDSTNEYNWSNGYSLLKNSELYTVKDTFHLTPSISLDIGELDHFGSTPSLKSYYAVTDEELAAVVESEGRNWRGIGIAMLVILVICGIIAISVFLLSPELMSMRKRLKKEDIDLNDVINGAFYPRFFNGTWLSSDQLSFRDEQENLVIWDIHNNQSNRKIIAPASLFRIHSILDYSISPDLKYLLVKQEMVKIFRHSYTAKFKIYRIHDEELFPLSPDLKQPDARLQFASWGPKENELVFIFNNNIYYKPSAESGNTIQITSDGNESVIYNGIPDWLYEEEILSDSSALKWSPSGDRLCFARFDDSQVDVIGLQFYTNEFLPRTYGIRYPRAGRRNPIVTIFMTELSSGTAETIEVKPPTEIVQSVDYYLIDWTWVDDSKISLVWSRRIQNYTVISLCTKESGWNCETLKTVTTQGRGWLEVNAPIFDETGKLYFLILPSFQDSQHGYYKHIAKFSVDNKTSTFLTSGLHEITKIYKYDSKNKILYYQATLPGKPGERHLFKVNVDNLDKTCLTCDLGSDCLYTRATINDDSSAYILGCLGPDIPREELRTTDSNELVVTLQANDALREKIDKILLPKVKTFQVPIEGGYNASVRLYLPPGLREDEITKYPLLISVYAGPGTQGVLERHDLGWGHYLSSRRGIIYGSIDGRGSGGDGDKRLHELYRRLGTVEIDDQIAVTRYLINNLPYIDSKRVGIWGWSYGGYAASMALASEPIGSEFSEPVFSCGIAVAPVTSWYYYDSTYTERYMGLPSKEDNLEGYSKADLIPKIKNIKGKRFLLVHGTADGMSSSHGDMYHDLIRSYHFFIYPCESEKNSYVIEFEAPSVGHNVHLQQSMLLMRYLQRSSILFESMIYPDQNHELPMVTKHLYRTIESFLNDCFDLGTIYEEIGLRRRRVIKKEYP